MEQDRSIDNDDDVKGERHINAPSPTPESKERPTSPFSNHYRFKEYLGENLNKPDEFGNVGLHRAVICNNMELLEVLLSQRNINLNQTNHAGWTPLMMSVKKSQMLFTSRLIEAGCDLNTTGIHQETLLHAAVANHKMDIALKLIELGLNINSQDRNKQTPLHHAVIRNNVEAVCLLLYYGADVAIEDNNIKSPFMYIAHSVDTEIAEILMNFYSGDDLSRTNIFGTTALFQAAKRRSGLAVRLVKAGANVNCGFLNENVLEYSLYDVSDELFKLVWPKFDYQILLRSKRPLLLTYIEECCFSAAKWVECLRIILESPIAPSLTDHYLSYIKYNTFVPDLFQNLLEEFYTKKVELNDRLNLLFLAFTLGVIVSIGNIKIAYELYDFNEEVEIFIYFADYSKIDCSKFCHLLLPFFLGLDDNIDVRSLTWLHSTDLPKPRFRSAMSCEDSQMKHYLSVMSFFSKPFYLKSIQYESFWWIYLHRPVYHKLVLGPEFSTLFELARNQTRTFIKQNFKIRKPYDFHDAVKRLNVPQKIQDVIRFKTPLY